MKYEITRGLVIKPQKVVVYGPEGIGKTSFAASFPDPLFIDTEGSTLNYDVARLPAPSSWTMLLDEVQEVIGNPSMCKTLVIDTIDWAEQLCSFYICSKHNKQGIEDFGYGNGYVYVKEELGRLLNLLTEVTNKGIHVVLTAHSQMRKFELPNESGSFDRYELKLGKKTSSQTAPLIKEWSDMLLFANYKTITISQKDGKTKAAGGQRVMYTTHHPNWDAKNRFDLSEELAFDYEAIKPFITNFSNKQAVTKEVPTVAPTPAPIEQTGCKEQIADTSKLSTLPKALQDLMISNRVTIDEIQQVVAEKGYYPKDTPIENYAKDFIDGCLIGAWSAVFEAIKTNRNIPF